MRAHPSLPLTEYSQRKSAQGGHQRSPELGVTHLKTGQCSNHVKGKRFILDLKKLAAQSCSVLCLQSRAYATEPSVKNSAEE